MPKKGEGDGVGLGVAAGVGVGVGVGEGDGDGLGVGVGVGVGIGLGLTPGLGVDVGVGDGWTIEIVVLFIVPTTLVECMPMAETSVVGSMVMVVVPGWDPAVKLIRAIWPTPCLPVLAGPVPKVIVAAPVVVPIVLILPWFKICGDGVVPGIVKKLLVPRLSTLTPVISCKL